MKVKTFLLGLALTCFSSFAFGAENPKKNSKTEDVKHSQLVINDIITEECFDYTMISDCATSNGRWCGSMDGFRKLVDAFFAEDCDQDDNP